MRKLSKIVAIASLISTLSSISAFADMDVKALDKFNRVGEPMTLAMTATGEWTQIGNDYGYTIDTSSLAEWEKEYFDPKEFVQEGTVRIDGDWYSINKDTHTINRNYWREEKGDDSIPVAPGRVNLSYYTARYYYGGDGKLAQIQYPITNGVAPVTYNIVQAPDAMAQSLIDAVNSYRTSHGVKALEPDKLLLTTSSIYAQYLPMDSRYEYEMKYLYTNTVGDVEDYYSTPYYRFMPGTGISQDREFISVGKSDVNSIVNEWATQKLIDHQLNYGGKYYDHDVTPNLLDKDVTCIGAACFYDAAGTPYWYMQIA